MCKFLGEFGLLIYLIDCLIVPKTLFFLIFVPNSGAVKQMLLELRLVNEHPFFIGTLYFVLKITAMCWTVCWSLSCLKFTTSSFTGNPEFAYFWILLIWLLLIVYYLLWFLDGFLLLSWFNLVMIGFHVCVLKDYICKFIKWKTRKGKFFYF